MSITLFDCTLRDGSYAIDFQFSAKFTSEYASAIDELGFGYIEIGHGMGIGASDKISRAAASDYEYAISTEKSVKKTKWGMFAQPAFSDISKVRQLVDLGMKFIRIGVDINQIDKGLDYVEKIKSLNIEIFVNVMKSYSVKPEDLYLIMERFVSRQVSGVYLVDSAGGMSGVDIESYAKTLMAFKNKTKLGFHGHDNLGLAVSNSYLISTLGFDQIDCTMQGIGRSSGNASAEKLLALMQKSGIKKDMDLIKLLKLGENFIRPKLPIAGHSGLDTFAGYTLFHTSYMDNLIKVSRDLGVDPYVLMQAHCRTNLISASMEELMPTAQKLLEEGSFLDSPLPLDRYVGHEQD